MKKTLSLLGLVLCLATSAWAVDSRVYGSYHLSGVASNGAPYAYDFEVGYDWSRRCESGYLYLPANNITFWSGLDQAGQTWTKASALDGNHMYFTEINATAAAQGQPVYGFYDLWFNDSFQAAVIAAYTDVYSPGAFLSLTGTASRI